MRNILYVIVSIIVALLTALGIPLEPARPPQTVQIAVSPQTLILNSEQGGWVAVHTNILASLVDRTSLALIGIPTTRTGTDARGRVVGYFPEADIKARVAPPGAVLTLTGLYLTGEPFSASATVAVKYN